jgi:ankyrin repeat protein
MEPVQTRKLQSSLRLRNAKVIKVKRQYGFLPIHTAVDYRRLESVRELVRLGSDIDAESRNGITPLYLACERGDLPIAEYLVAHGAKVNHAGGYNPLHEAAYRGRVDLVSLLLKHGANINLQNRSGTSLHMASVGDHPEVVSLLLERGADREKQDCDGLTAVDRAALEKLSRIVDLLINNGAIRTLIAAIYTGNLDAVKEFLRDRPNCINGGAGLNGATPLHYAAQFGQLDLCKYLLAHGANRAARSQWGFLPAHFACHQKNGDVLRAVCTREAANAQGDSESTPLHFCAEEDNVELGRILISEFGADLNKRGFYGMTPLLVAFNRGHDSFCKLLIESNADVNVTKDVTGHTPLHYALRNPWKPALAELLLQHGADPYAKGVGDETPWEIAQRREDSKDLFRKYMKKP